MLRPAAALACAVAALCLAACGGDGSGIVFKDPKGTIDVEEGMTFSLELGVNASVGYDWEAVGPRGGDTIVELKETKVDYPNPESIGDSGTKRFVYEARETGRQAVVLRKLFRGDEQERRIVTVVIRGG